MPRNPGGNTILAAGLLAIAAGCQQQQSPGRKERQDLRDSWAKGEVSEETVVQHPGSVAVKAGMSPLIYQARQAGIAHIQDATTGAELASVSVSRGSLIRVDDTAGVFGNGKRTAAGSAGSRPRVYYYDGPRADRELAKRERRNAAAPPAGGTAGQRAGPLEEQTTKLWIGLPVARASRPCWRHSTAKTATRPNENSRVKCDRW